jgi:hypothetical protein
MHVFIEAEEGVYVLKVSPYAAGRPTAMHQRGKPFPASYRTEYDSVELAAIGLQELTEYFKCYEEKRVSKKRVAN